MIVTYNVDHVKVIYDDEIFSKAEIREYVKIAKQKLENVKSIAFKLKGDQVELDYTAENLPFERIRRITGYLTGDLTSWNNAKRAEESERVKHN